MTGFLFLTILQFHVCSVSLFFSNWRVSVRALFYCECTYVISWYGEIWERIFIRAYLITVNISNYYLNSWWMLIRWNMSFIGPIYNSEGIHWNNVWQCWFKMYAFLIFKVETWDAKLDIRIPHYFTPTIRMPHYFFLLILGLHLPWIGTNGND